MNIPEKKRQLKLMHVVTVPATLTFFIGQLDYMRERDFNVSVVASPDPDFIPMLQTLRVVGHPIPMEREIAPLKDLISLFRLWQLFRRMRPNIVHGHTPKGGFLSMLAAWLAGVPHRVYHIRGLRFATTSGFKRGLLKIVERVTCAIAQKVIAVGPSVMNEAIDEGICPKSKISYLANGSSNGVDAWRRFNPTRVGADARHRVRQTYGISSGDFVIAFVGRLVRDKGLEELARAWRIIRRERPNVHMLIAGRFESGDPVPQRIREELESDERVHFTGYTRNMPEIYSAVDLVLFPTYREGLPNVLLEAAAMEIPVVATQVTGCVDAVLDGITGSLVPPRDYAALAREALKYIDNQPLRIAHGQAGREWVQKKFSPERIWDALHQEYLQLTGAG